MWEFTFRIRWHPDDDPNEESSSESDTASDSDNDLVADACYDVDVCIMWYVCDVCQYLVSYVTSHAKTWLMWKLLIMRNHRFLQICKTLAIFTFWHINTHSTEYSTEY